MRAKIYYHWIIRSSAIAYLCCLIIGWLGVSVYALMALAAAIIILADLGVI